MRRQQLLVDARLVPVTVEVSAGAPAVNTEDATLGHAFGTEKIESLPFEGRDPVGILSLQPGVVWVGKNVDQHVVRQFFDHVMQKPSLTRF